MAAKKSFAEQAGSFLIAAGTTVVTSVAMRGITGPISDPSARQAASRIAAAGSIKFGDDLAGEIAKLARGGKK